MSLPFGPQAQTKILRPLLKWYIKHGRHDMPWRKTKDPYAIVVSEYMLQQTTVTAVRPYYEKFLKKFPTLKSLAHASLDQVLARWSGLGYYARARNLWAAMKMVVKDFKGDIPVEQLHLQKLPGVGLYTSGAISSLAFNRPAMVLDGNIMRVLMRLLALEEDPRLKAVQVILRKVSLDLTTKSLKLKGVTPKGPRHTVLALMDLGATVCLPQNPKCPECPLKKSCLAREYGKQNEIPGKGDEVDRSKIRRLYALIPYKGKWLMAQRPKEGLFGGLWEFVGVDAKSGVEPIQVIEEAVKTETGLVVRVVQALKTFEHQLTHRDITVRPFFCRPMISVPYSLPRKGIEYTQFRWVTLKELENLGLSAITKKIFTLLEDASSRK